MIMNDKNFWTKSNQEILLKLDGLSDKDLQSLLTIFGLKTNIRNDNKYIRAEDRFLAYKIILDKNNKSKIAMELSKFKSNENVKKGNFFEIRKETEYSKIESHLTSINHNLVIIDGDKIHSNSDLFGAFKEQLKFPYFGNNWDALDYCLINLEWLKNKNTAVLIRNFDSISEGIIKDLLGAIFERNIKKNLEETLLHAHTISRVENYAFMIYIFNS